MNKIEMDLQVELKIMVYKKKTGIMDLQKMMTQKMKKKYKY